MQHEIRAIVRRLHPVGLAEFGLQDAIGDLIRFWGRRHPGITFQFTIAPECTRVGEAAETTLYRIVQECLSNAVRHGAPAQIDIHIRRTSTDGGVRIMAEITDDGPGFADTVIDRIGEPYVSVRNRKAEGPGGLGLGIFIAKTLLERTGASLVIRNRPYPEKGASVLVRWPREKFRFEAPPQEDEIRSAVLKTGVNASIATEEAAE